METMQHMRGWEDLRWIATAAFLCWTVFIFLLLIIGLARKSKCCLFVFAAFGKQVVAWLILIKRSQCNKALKTYYILSFHVLATITLVLCWTVVSAYLGTAVGVADLCVQPHGKSISLQLPLEPVFHLRLLWSL